MIPFGFWKNNFTYQYLNSADYPTFCWSFWKRNPNYNGACIRIKIESGGAEHDIGFGSNNFLNVSNMQSLVGNGTAYVIKWYEQFSSNSAFNLFPHYLAGAGLGYVPRIIISGVLQTFKNGNASIPFNSGWASSFCMMNCGAGTNMITQFNSSIYWSEENGNSVIQSIFGNNNENSVMATRQIGSTGGTTTFYDFSAQPHYFLNESKELEGGENTAFAVTAGQLYVPITYRITEDGARLLGVRSIGYNTLGTGFSVGGRWSNGNGYFRGKLNEVLIYNNITHTEEKVREIQSVLNKSHNFYNTNSISHNLVLYYDAGNTLSYPGTGTAITDLSVTNKNGVLVNGTSYSSADGGKFVLDGVNDWISAGSNFSDSEYPLSVESSDYTIECWVKLSNTNQSFPIFGTIGNNINNVGRFMIFAGTLTSFDNTLTSSKKVSFGIRNRGGERPKTIFTTNDVIDGGWKHILVTRTGAIIKIYINGIDQPTTVSWENPGNHIWVKSFKTFRAGSYGNDSGGAGAFDISIMRVYKCRLTQAQVTRNFNLEKSRYGL